MKYTHFLLRLCMSQHDVGQAPVHLHVHEKVVGFHPESLLNIYEKLLSLRRRLCLVLMSEIIEKRETNHIP